MMLSGTSRTAAAVAGRRKRKRRRVGAKMRVGERCDVITEVLYHISCCSSNNNNGTRVTGRKNQQSCERKVTLGGTRVAGGRYPLS